MAGQIAELARGTLRGEFRSIDSGQSRVLLIETFDHVLTTFPPSLSRRAARSLESLGVTPLLERTVVDIDEEAVSVAAPDGATERIPARTVIWAAGVEASRLASELGELTGAELGRAGRVTVAPDLTLPGHPEVLALGDMVRVRSHDGGVQALLGVAPVAMQQGRYAAMLVRARLSGHPIGAVPLSRQGQPRDDRPCPRSRRPPRHPTERLPRLGRLAGGALFYLVGFQNRLIVVIRWFISFVTRGRGARLITSTPTTKPALETRGMSTTEPIRPPQAPSDDRQVVGR
jgi:NADH:ubiquinone reductase (H+-translocating)